MLGAIENLTFTIKSTATDKELRLSGPGEYEFTVELQGTEIYAIQRIYCPLGSSEFTQFFARLASYERPWSATEHCASLEGDFSLSARCSAVGIVTFSISILRQFGGPEEWKLTCDLDTELGQLPRIASQARNFFGPIAGT